MFYETVFKVDRTLLHVCRHGERLTIRQQNYSLILQFKSLDALRIMVEELKLSARVTRRSAPGMM